MQFLHSVLENCSFAFFELLLKVNLEIGAPGKVGP